MVKVFPLWDKDNGKEGAGTVKVSILDANGDPASAELISSVEEYIDPEPKANGLGQAPIGANVTIATATAKPCNVAATVELGATASGIEAIEAEFETLLDEYFHTLAYDGETDSMSVALVGRVLLDTPGVVDYANLTINGGTQSISIGDEEVITVGTINLTEAP